MFLIRDWWFDYLESDLNVAPKETSHIKNVALDGVANADESITAEVTARNDMENDLK